MAKEPAAKRVASLSVSKHLTGTVLTASVAPNISAADFGKLGSQIIDVIRGHTGCACLSGQIRVVLEEHMGDVIQVELGPVAAHG